MKPNPDNKHSIATPTHTPQLQAFCEVVESRRSIRRFTDTPIPDEVLTDCFRLAMLAPNSSNLQPWEFYVIDDADNRKRAVKNCMNQNAAKTSARLIAVVARTDVWRDHAQQVLREYPDKPVAKQVKDYYTKVVAMDFLRGPANVASVAKWGATQVFRRVKGPIKSPYYTFEDTKNWATNNTALAAENLMLALRAYGFDSCAMGGFDEPAMKQLLNLSDDQHIIMMIGAGERADNGVYNTQFRFDQTQFVHYV
ncbi:MULTISPECIES: nitroreductase family protein [unclassified Psychrobacter]|uniref:nitroreductase family protein n=1 Tax=unclassified Psychrobacter TaxID=196806 RepID=UPI0025B342D0|nr:MULTISPECIES: nitroreductase family protein [unclassified Psychrobacter]MDN3453243.1 nitroreductase family protein [Psychrobacter sp. APC 3350]MDN3503422.1 nitroreductase family protein [Psychrobacter sp. 5A.1]